MISAYTQRNFYQQQGGGAEDCKCIHTERTNGMEVEEDYTRLEVCVCVCVCARAREKDFVPQHGPGVVFRGGFRFIPPMLGIQSIPGDRNCEIETAVWIYVGNTSLLP
jgi:hypothetical protein